MLKELYIIKLLKKRFFLLHFPLFLCVKAEICIPYFDQQFIDIISEVILGINLVYQVQLEVLRPISLIIDFVRKVNYF